MNTLGDLPAWAIVAIGLLALVQLGLQAFALIIVLRTPPDRLLTGRRISSMGTRPIRSKTATEPLDDARHRTP